jgi:hypothetical protein
VRAEVGRAADLARAFSPPRVLARREAASLREPFVARHPPASRIDRGLRRRASARNSSITRSTPSSPASTPATRNRYRCRRHSRAFMRSSRNTAA